MKVLIGYDGSPSANEALEELKRVGLPDETEVLIVSVGDVWMPPPNAEISPEALASRRVSAALARLQNQAERTLKETEETSAEAARRVKSDFPGWLVETETTDKPVIKRIEDSSPFCRLFFLLKELLEATAARR